MNSNSIKNRRKSIDKKEIIRVIYIAIIIVFCFIPLLLLLFNISKQDLTFVFSDNNFKLSIINSLIYTSISTLCSTLLAVISAYFLSRSSINKNIITILLTLPMLIPTLSVGLGIRVLFGTNGLLDVLFNFNYDALGFFGLIIGSIIISFPPTFLIIYDALRYENKSPYDAAEIMGIKKISTFFRVTVPYLMKPLFTAFFACFTLVFSDYGIPMEVAGRIKTLPMYLYEQITSLFKYGRGALVGVFLLVPALVSFVVDLYLKEELSDDVSKSSIKPSKKFDFFSGLICTVILLFIAIPELSFISVSFLKNYTSDPSFTFENIENVFTNTHGVGLLGYIGNSITMSLLTGIFGVIFAYTLAYFSTRNKGKASNALHFLSISSIAIPGIVLGIGYIFLFKETKGWFYGTIAILVVVNMIHFLGSPYIMARNSFSKMNKDYEIVGDTIGVSHARIFLQVLLPNSISTIIEMFSYFFLNSMITISAVAFLNTYANQPLSILITTYEKTGNYEMQAVVSLTILIINLFFKTTFFIIKRVLKKKSNEREYEMISKLTKSQFDLLTYLEKNGRRHYTQRSLSDSISLSLGTINKLIKEVSEAGYISVSDDGEMYITEKGLSALKPYKVKKAIILAAGFSSRLAPVTLVTPKPLVSINSVRIIDTLIDALLNKGIDNITVVRGYKKEQFDVLLEKYPFLQFVDNDDFNTTNNISSIMKVVERIDRCYICEADLFISNEDVISKYEYATCYLGAKVAETEDWCFKNSNGYVSNFQMGGEDCYIAYGISYWNEKDSVQLRADITKTYNSRAGKENFWEAIPLRICKNNYRIELKKCHKSDVIEIDNFDELVAVDESYAEFPGHEQF